VDGRATETERDAHDDALVRFRSRAECAVVGLVVRRRETYDAQHADAGAAAHVALLRARVVDEDRGAVSQGWPELVIRRLSQGRTSFSRPNVDAPAKNQEW
jgi:hypothetical protein